MSGKIEILLHNQLLEVDLDDLKGNDDALIGILSQDSTNYRLFLEFAFEYHKRGMILEFEKFLLAGKTQYSNRNSNKEKHLLLLNTLASYYIEQAKKLKGNETMPSVNSTEPRTSMMLLNQSLEILNEAEKISRTDKFTYVGKANIILLSQNSKDLDKVFANYKSALNIDPNFIPALIGLAGVHYQRKNYKAALSFYQKVLTIQPDINPDVRMPIGICFYKLDMEEEASLAFQRVLELDPENSNAILMLSLMELNKSKSADISPADKKLLVKSSGARVLKAFQLDPRNGLCTSQLAIRFLDKDARKAGVMASSSLLYTSQPSILAEGYFLKGVISQKEGDYAEALKNFKEAATLLPKTPLYQFHLAQCYLEAGEIDNGIKCLEVVLVTDPQDYDSLKLLFNLYAMNPSNSDKAASQLENISKIIIKNSGKEIKSANFIEDVKIKDPELLVDVAEYLEKSNIFAARRSIPNELILGYLELYSILEKKGLQIPPELLNNIAVLYHIEADSINSFYQGQYQVNCKILPEDTTESNLNEALGNAQNLYEQALTKLAESKFVDKEEYAERVTALQTTIRFNVSRLYEAKGEIEKAELNYKELLKVCPALSDCLLRLGAIELSKGDTGKAIDYFSDALAIDSRHSEAWFMIGNLYKKLKNYRASRKSFEKVLMNEKYNTYALCSAGNLCLVFARGDREDESRKLHFTRSIEYFCKVLSLEPTNIHAAAGIAIAYAETGKFVEARDVFNHIQELTAGDTRMALNTGHVLVELGQLHQAVTLYESILKKGGLKNDVVVLHALSRVHFIIAKTSKSAESMKTSRLYIQKAIHANPSDKSLLFNLALIEQQTGQVLNEQTSETRSVDDLKAVLKDIDLSEKLFKFLASFPPSPDLKYDPLRAKERGTFCVAVRKSAEKNIHQSEVMRRQREERLQEIKERKAQAELEAKQEKEALRLAMEAKEAEVEAKRRELLLKMQEDNEKSRISKRGADDSDDEGKGTKRPRKKKQVAASDDDEPREKNNRIIDSDED